MSDQRLVLTPPGPVPAVSTDQAAASAQIDPAAAEKITATVGAFVEGLAALDPHSPDFQKKVDSISQLGNQEIRQSAEVSNRFLERPAAAMERGPLGAGSQVSRSLVQLLAYANQAPWKDAFHSSLPIAGKSELLRRRMRATPAQGNLHAKTGTTNSVISLGGYVTAKNGEMLAFAFIYNGVDRWNAKSTIDAMGATLASFNR